MEKSSIKMIFQSKRILIVSMAHCTFAMAMGIFATLFPIYAKEDLLLPTTIIALLFTARGFVNAISRYPSGKLSDRIGRKKPILIGYVLLTLSFLIISQTNYQY